MITKRRFFRNKNRIYMIPTRFGAALCLLFLFFTFAGAHYSNNLIFLFAFIIVSFLLIAILQTAKNLRGLEVLSVHIPNGFPNEYSRVEILVQNPRKTEKFGLSLHFKNQKDHVIVDEIFPQDQKWVFYPFLLPVKRGRFKPPRLRISTDAPYGLFYGWYYLYPDSEGVVYPQLAGHPRDDQDLPSAGADFSGLKKYTLGDPFQRISWKHSAKREEWLLKEFNDDTPASELYDINDCPQTNIEGKLSQLALWVAQAEQHQKSYGIILHQRVSPIGRGDYHLNECLYELGIHND